MTERMTVIFMASWVSCNCLGCNPPCREIVEIADKTAVTVVTYNIYRDYFTRDNPASPQAWSVRRLRVVSLLQACSADIICLQEDDYVQGEDICKALHYAKAGVSRYTGSETTTDLSREGDFNGVYYRSSRFRITDRGHFFFSETPDIPSKSWDAQANSHCNWFRMEDAATEKSFYLFNTHLDYVGEQTRLRSVEMLRERIPQIAGDAPVVLTGDLNDGPESRPLTGLREFLRDSYWVSETPVKGPEGTFNDFQDDYDLDRWKFDYILVGGSVRVLTHRIITEKREGHYPSDHLPVVCDLEIE